MPPCFTQLAFIKPQIMARIHLRVFLPKNRDYNGTMAVDVDGQEVASFPVKGRGSRGAGDTVFLKGYPEKKIGGGNTPTGTYRGSVEETKNRNEKTFGHNGAVRLNPIGGDALIAARIFGRSGLLIHGGSPTSVDYWKSLGGLHPTNGCLRLSDENVKALMEIISKNRHDDKMQMSVEPEISISVVER